MSKLKKFFLAALLIAVCSEMCIIRGESLQLPSYPKYKEVVTWFFSGFSVSNLEWPNQFVMAKKPDGWHAMVLNMVNNEVIQDELYWSRATNTYNQLTFPINELEEGIESAQQTIDDWSNNYFTRILPYWGYVGWDKDVIDEFGAKDNLSDTLLNALARAYTSYASNLLNNNTGYSIRESRFDLPKGQDALTAEQLEKFRNYEHLGINTYYKLWQLNPGFETFVADIFNVYSNEVMNCYLTILYHQNEAEAKKELKPGLYDSFFRDMAKKYLGSCDKDGILITNGDNDTYPLLYMQEAEGFRKDVTVINISMLSSGRYVSHLFRSVAGRETLNFSLPVDFYRSETRQVVYLMDQSPSIELKTAIDFVASTDQDAKLELNGELNDYLPSREILINFKLDDAQNPFLANSWQVQMGDNPMVIDLQGNYLLMNQFCFLDILNANFSRRPIYMAVSVSSDNFLGLDKYFQCEGLAFQITPFRNDSAGEQAYVGFMDSRNQYRKLMGSLASHIADPAQKYYAIQKNFIQNYRNNYSRLAEKLINENKKDSAIKVLDYINKEFPAEKAEHLFFSLSMLESYYRLGLIDKADQLAEVMMQTAIDKGKAYIDAPTDDDYEIRLSVYLLNNLSEITAKYNPESELHGQIKDAHEKMDSAYTAINFLDSLNEPEVQ